MAKEAEKITVAIKPIDEFRKNLQLTEGQFQAALPPTITPEKFIRVVMTAVQANLDLLEANRTTLFAACMKCAADGLLPDGREAALVVYATKSGKVVQYMPMIAGILKKIRNSGEIGTLTSQIIYQNDEFDYWVDDDGEHLKHKPMLFGDRGELIGAYAMAKTKDGHVYREIMNNKQLKDVQNSSKAKDSGPWGGVFKTEMIRKTVVRRLSKRLPMSSDLEKVIQRDDELYDLTSSGQQAVAAPKEMDRLPDAPPVSRLDAIIDSQTSAAPPAAEDATPATIMDDFQNDSRE